MREKIASIVIVNWKTPKLLSQALQSLLADLQSNNFEIWVVDNNSGDGSVEMLRRDFPMVNTIANSDNVGFGRACNQVIPLCNAPLILLVNPDTFAQNGAVSTLAAYMDANPDCGAVGPKVLNPDGSLQLSCRRSFPDLAASLFRLTYLSFIFPRHPLLARYNLTYADPDDLIEVDALSGAFMMVRKQAVEQIGLLDEEIFMFGEDIDWCWRIKQAGWKIVYQPAALVYHYHGASSKLRRVGATINLHKGMEIFYRKHMAVKHSLPVNLLVYASIWLRAGIFICLSAIQQLLPDKTAVEIIEKPDLPAPVPSGSGTAHDASSSANQADADLIQGNTK